MPTLTLTVNRPLSLCIKNSTVKTGRESKINVVLSVCIPDGIRDKDKASMSSILHNVAVFSTKDNSYTLARHLYDVIREDWPGYTDVDKQLLKR